MNKKTIAIIISLNFILPALVLAQGGEVMDGIGRMKKSGKPFPFATSTASTTTIIKDVIDGGKSVHFINPEILKAIKEGQRGEELILFIKKETDKLKDKKLMFADEINAKREDLKKILI